MKALSSILSWLCDGYWPTADGDEELLVRIQDVRHRYTPLRLFASGDSADIYFASTTGESNPAEETLHLLKVACSPGDNSHLENERKTLTRLLSAAGNTTYRHYLPALVDSFATRGRLSQRINVFRWKPGFYTLEQVHEQHPVLVGRHLAWIFKRLLTALGFIHRQNMVHGAVLPCHALIHPAGHGLLLVGWGQSVAVGQRLRTVPARYQEWYPAEVQQQRPASPATDLFLAARCLIYLAGGDPVTNRMPETVPPPMQRFFKACLLDSAAMRPDDAWGLLEEFDDLLHRLYGPPKFHELSLT